MVYRNLSGYLREKYSQRLKKICIDGGFTCPNRDGRCGVGGCIFCGERGAGEHIDADKSIGEQVRAALAESDSDDRFIAYFQNFTNTYAPVEVLRKKYDSALIDERIRILAIGTRPDCIDEEIAELLAEYAKRLDVWVELGLQSANDGTAKIINRGYLRSDFERAMDILTRHGIPVVVHLIVGLPSEEICEVKETAEYISHFPIFGIKIHSIYVMPNTRLAKMYESGEYEPPTLEEYVESAVYILTHISPEVVVHRLTGDAPSGELLAPEWNKNKHKVIDAIVKKMEEENLVQGKFYSKNLAKK